MYSRDSPSIFTNTNLLLKKVVFSGNSLNVSIVTPCEKGQFRTSTIYYGRIRRDLNIYTFKEVLKAKFTNYLEKIKYFDNEEYIFYQYDNQPKLFILKSEGKIYSDENNNMAQLEAFRLLRALVKFGIVQGYHRVQQDKKVYTKEGLRK